MDETSRWSWHGWMRAVISEHDGLCPWVLGTGKCRCRPRSEAIVVPNLITTVGKNLIRDGIRNAANDTAIHYCALGTSTTAPAAGDTKLTAENFRKLCIKYAAGANGESIVTALIAPGEAIFTIQEVGWFAGSAATSAKDSGVITSHLLWAHTKTALESLQLDHHDQF